LTGGLRVGVACLTERQSKNKRVKSAVDSWYILRRGGKIFSISGLVRYLKRDSLKEIRKISEIQKNNSVSSVIKRVKKEIRKDKDFKKRVEELIAKLRVNGRLDPYSSMLHKGRSEISSGMMGATVPRFQVL